MENFLFAPIIIFMVIVAPTWIVMLYKTASKKAVGLSTDEQNSLDELSHIAENMEQRIKTLEAILDNETPQWRQKYEA